MNPQTNKLWVFGNTIRTGMQPEIDEAENHAIPVRNISYFSVKR